MSDVVGLEKYLPELVKEVRLYGQCSVKIYADETLPPGEARVVGGGGGYRIINLGVSALSTEPERCEECGGTGCGGWDVGGDGKVEFQKCPKCGGR